MNPEKIQKARQRRQAILEKIEKLKTQVTKTENKVAKAQEIIENIKTDEKRAWYASKVLSYRISLSPPFFKVRVFF